MKYLKSFNNIILENSQGNKIYTNINNIIDGTVLDYYQIPFSLGENGGTCIPDEEDYIVCFSDNFVYDYIKDVDIEKGLGEDLSDIDINKDWTNFAKGYEHSRDNKNTHILRISKIVKELLNNKKITPVIMQFDSMSYNYDIRNHIEDGNHRIRALQYLRYGYFPAFIGGSHREFLIKYLSKNYSI